MKKWLILIIVLVVACLTTLYFLRSATQTQTFETTIGCSQRAVARHIINRKQWIEWWPGKKISENNFSFKDCNYKIGEILLNGFKTVVYHNNDSLKGLLQFIYFGTDSTQFKWTSTYTFSKNPLKRWEEKKHLKVITDNVHDLVSDMKKYFSDSVKVYGMAIKRDTVKDSTMISFKGTFDHYPSTGEIYNMIHAIRNYIQSKGGEESDYPMLNVRKVGAERFETMLAVPTQRDVPPGGKFEIKKMVLGNILVSQVTGGVQRVKEGEKQLANYVEDFGKMSPAIPFQSLVTERIAEPDSSKWITRLYYPIFY